MPNTIRILARIIFTIILGTIFISLHACDKSIDLPKQITEEISESDIDKYLDSILLASNDKNINENENFYKISDLFITKAINENFSALNLSKTEKEKIISSYKNSKAVVIDVVNKEIIEKNNLNQKTDISYKYLESLNGFSESIINISCTIIKIPLKSMPLQITQLTLKSTSVDKKCKAILSEPIEHIATKLREKGIIKDINIITSKLQDRIRASILKLASAQDTINFEINNIEKRNFDLFNIEFSRESQLNAKIKSTIIAGFDLSSFKINIDHFKKEVSIHLPKPTIISSNSEVNFQEPSTEAFAPKIDSSTYNKINIEAKERALKEAKTEKIFDEAKKNAYKSIINIFQPLMSLPQFNYKVNVYFDQDFYLDKDIKDKDTIIIPKI
jgi:hypothetical protein